MAEIIRLNKVLRELNISLDRAVDFLETKNVEIEKRPTTKITSEVYDLLAGEFQTDASKKVASKEVGEAKLKEKEALRLQREQEIELKLQKAEAAKTVLKAKQVLQGPKKVGKIDLDGPKKTTQQQLEELKPAAAQIEEPPKVERCSKRAPAPKVESAAPKAFSPKLKTTKVEHAKSKVCTSSSGRSFTSPENKRKHQSQNQNQLLQQHQLLNQLPLKQKPLSQEIQKVETTNYQKLSGPKSTGSKNRFNPI